jgi:LSD1 subclass zinc finger protein
VSDRPCPMDRCGAALPPGAVICGGCTTRARLDLREVPALLAELDLALSRQSSMPPGSGMLRCGRPECTHEADEPGCVQGVRLDLDQRASDAALALRLCLHGWVRVVDEERPVVADDYREDVEGSVAYRIMRASRDRAMATAQGQAALLAAAVSTLRRRDWLPDLAQEIRDAVREGWAAVDRPPDSTVVGQCPGCRRTLYAPEGADLVRCSGCGTTAGRTDVREASLAESRTLLPVVQLAVVIEVPERTVRSWIARKRLVSARCDLAGKPVYRISDGLTLKGREDPQDDPERVGGQTP